jgi:basic membrane protein A
LTLSIAALLTALASAGLASLQASAATSSTPRVGLVLEGGLEDRGLNQLGYTGLVLAERQLGVKARVLQAGSAAGVAENLAAFARQGFDLVVAVGHATAHPLAVVAKRFPDTRFAIVDVDQRSLEGTPTNVTGLVFDEQQLGYLAGYLAGLSAKRLGARAVSAVGIAGDPHGARLLAGYRTGVSRAAPGIRVLRDDVKGDADRATCRGLALGQLEHGASVVMGVVAGPCGLGVLDAARQRRAWGIGVDADEAPLGAYVLTSTVKGADVAVFAAIRSLVRGQLAGGRNVRFGLTGGGVRLGAVSPRAARADVDATQRVARLLAGGASIGTATPGG